MLQDLAQSGVVARTPCGEVILTDEGKAIAMDLYLQYRTLLRFFMQNLQIDGPQAREDSITAIVNLSPTCVRQFAKYIRDIKSHHLFS
jgi:Mn-dependent DtxR family transcriptional regulator